MRFLSLIKSSISPPSVPCGNRVYAIGDIHGRVDFLRDLMKLIREDQENRPRARLQIIVLGDFIDRGPASADVVATLQAWQRTSSSVVVLKGNHEAIFLAALNGDVSAQRMWPKHGGAETLGSFGIEPAEPESHGGFAKLMTAGIGEETISWFEQLPISHRVGNYFFCHAGVKPSVALENQRAEDLLWIGNEFLESKAHHGAVIVHGHSICGSRVEFAWNRICVDTGAYLSGVLSAVGLEEHRQWSVSTRASLLQDYPELRPLASSTDSVLIR